ncbi:Major facilitator superfamily transporter [Cordyceps javanica]|uniref:Major facilitator superfamily transporter n=1 Tax=Cordyceps javanica TaxID=43265 RepID=A0A545UPU2_9HYPO|nr:Major facilitator superfamily transporter [Cordyceps javanica]TQW03121.1 Major facilitator superfamily transporter [Cordyceps javanica]
MPQPAFGSYEILKIRDDVCFDRFGRYGPYGLGYSKALGGLGCENDTENSDTEHVWAETGPIDYRHIDWADAQRRCYESNKDQSGTAIDQSQGATKSESRTAIVIRSYEGFTWTPMVILNLRAMITELSLKTGGEYSVHLLMQAKDARLPLWIDGTVRETYLHKHVPVEFHGLVTLWSERQMKLLYPGDFSSYYRNPTGKDIHDVYRSPHFALQDFAKEHPEYRHVWNWELDVRVLGNYYEFLDRISKWSDSRPRDLLWEHNERYFIPRYHKSWANFTETIRKQEQSEGQAIMGPLTALWRKKLSFEEAGGTVLPADCPRRPETCGVGEEADLITLNPIFDVGGSDWYFTQDVTGYDKSLRDTLPRRAAIVTAGRYSRRLLTAMHEEVRRHNRSMFAEMFPATVALHHGLKAVYAPHPVYVDRAWAPASAVDRHFNSGERHSTSGRKGPFSLATERVHAVTSWYYKSDFPQQLWTRWLGYADSAGRGGREEESRRGSGGRMCLRSMLLHPIKHEHPAE